jgi:hypothetical protein
MIPATAADAPAIAVLMRTTQTGRAVTKARIEGDSGDEGGNEDHPAGLDTEGGEQPTRDQRPRGTGGHDGAEIPDEVRRQREPDSDHDPGNHAQCVRQEAVTAKPVDKRGADEEPGDEAPDRQGGEEDLQAEAADNESQHQQQDTDEHIVHDDSPFSAPLW